MKNILPAVWMWSDVAEEKGYPLNGWLIAAPGGSVVIDPAHFDRESIEILDPFKPVSTVLLTNKDHERAAAAVRERFGSAVSIHEADAGLLMKPPQATFRDGDVLAGFLRVIHLADQKTPGECALLWEEQRILWLGDALIGNPPGTLQMLPAEKFKDAARAKEGLRRLLDLRFSVVLVGDGVPLMSGGRGIIERLVAEKSEVGR